MRTAAILIAVITVNLPPASASLPERVPAWLIELPPSVSEVLVAEAGAAALMRFENNGHGIVQKDARYMSIGKNGVGKQRAWDRRTPLGIYFITEELDTRQLHEKYGDAAFVLDYPNAWDRYRERTGDGIWLHGVDRRDPERPPLDTDGCLALPNHEIKRLAADLQPLVTPVIVARSLRWANAAEIDATRAEFRAVLARWAESQAATDIDAYLSLYAEDFRARSMDKAAWSEWRRAVFAAHDALASASIDDVMLLADPEEPGLYLSRFTLALNRDGREVRTRKRLYWRRSDAGTWRIVTEDNG